MPESNEGAGLLEALRNEAIPPSTVDIGDLVIRGRKRVRTRRRVGMCAAAIGVAAAITIPIILVTQRANRTAPPTVDPKPPTSCTVARLALPDGFHTARVLSGDSSGRYLAGIAFNGNESRQVVWRDGKVMAPGLPAGDVAPVVNAKGEIAFFSNNIPYVFRAGRFMPLPQPDGYESYRPIQINDRGEVLGIYVEASEGRLLIWGANGRITRVADKPFVPTGLGNDGTVVGVGERRHPGDIHGVMWPEGSGVVDLPSPQGMGSVGPRTFRAGWAGGYEGSPVLTETAPPMRIWNVYTGQSVAVPPEVTRVGVVNSHGWAGVDLGNRPALLAAGKLLALGLPSGVADRDQVKIEALSDDGRTIGGSVISADDAATGAALIWRCA